MRRAARWAILALALLASRSRGAEAQRGQQRSEREQLENRVRVQMGRLMRERLGLDEAEAQRLSEVVQSFEVRRRELFGQEQATRRRVEALLLEGSNDQEAARELITRMWELRAEEAQLFREEQEALLDVLTPVQVLRLQELRQDLGRRIRELGGGRGGRGALAPGGGGRGGRQGAAAPEPGARSRGLQPVI